MSAMYLLREHLYYEINHLAHICELADFFDIEFQTEFFLHGDHEIYVFDGVPVLYI